MPNNVKFENSVPLFEKTMRHNPKLDYLSRIFQIFEVFDKVALFCLWLRPLTPIWSKRVDPLQFCSNFVEICKITRRIRLWLLEIDLGNPYTEKSQIKITINFATIGKITLLCRKLRKFENPRQIIDAPRRAH